MAIDGQGRFLFVLNPISDDVSMFQIDQTSGALAEVPGSPFAVPPIVSTWFPPGQPLSLAATGQFVFVSYLYANCGDTPANGGGGIGPSAVASLAIDTTGSSPVISAVTALLLNSSGSPIQLLTDSKGLLLYLGMGVGNDGTQASGPEVYSIDGAGNLSYQGIAPNPENHGTDFAMDAKGRFIFAAGGLEAAHILSCVISPVDGSITGCGGLIDLNFAAPGMFVESSGHFLYLPDSSQSVVVYSIDPATGDLTQVGSVNGISPAQGATVADPSGPYVYSAGLNAYLVDQQTGNLTPLPGSPFADPGKTLVTSPSSRKPSAVRLQPFSLPPRFRLTPRPEPSALRKSFLSSTLAISCSPSIPFQSLAQTLPAFPNPIPASQPWLPALTVRSASPSTRQPRVPSAQLFKLPTMLRQSSDSRPQWNGCGSRICNQLFSILIVLSSVAFSGHHRRNLERIPSADRLQHWKHHPADFLSFSWRTEPFGLQLHEQLRVRACAFC